MSDTEQTAEPTREDLVAAGEAAAEESRTLGEEGKPVEAPKPAEPAAETADEPRWQRLVRERDKAHAERQEAQNYAANARKEAEEERAKIIEAAKQEARDAAARELAEHKARFASDPIARLREIGSPEEVADAIARAGTPEFRAMQKLQEEFAETKKRAGAADDVKKQFESWKKQQEEAAIAQRNANAEQIFMTQHATPDKTPYLHARYDQSEMIQRANQIAISWREAGQTNFDLSDIAGYMEHEAKKRYDALSAKSQPQVNGAAPQSGSAPKVPANGPRTISGSSTGDRRSAPKPLDEMDAKQRRQALVEEADAIIKSFEATQK